MPTSQYFDSKPIGGASMKNAAPGRERVRELSEAAAPIRLVYILAASHSGSTLLAMVLGAQPEICTVGELSLCNLGAAESYRCSCGEWLRECEFWRRVSATMGQWGHKFDVAEAHTDFRLIGGNVQRRLLRPLHRGRLLEALRDLGLALTPGWNAAYARMQARNRALARAVLEVSQKRVLIDSSKSGLRLKYVLRDPAFDVRIIRLVRDGRAVALTYLHPEHFADALDATQRGGGAGRVRPATATNWKQAIALWKRSNQEAEALLKNIPLERRFDLRYEDFCEKPGRTVRDIRSFLGLDPESASLEFRAHSQHVIGNGMRMDRTSNIQVDNRWRGVVSSTELREFDAIAGGLNRKYGYA